MTRGDVVVADHAGNFIAQPRRVRVRGRGNLAMLTYAVALAFFLCGLLWGAVEYWRLDRRRTAIAAAAAGCVAGAALIGVIYILRGTDNPWAWIGMPMACRYTLHGC